VLFDANCKQLVGHGNGPPLEVFLAPQPHDGAAASGRSLMQGLFQLARTAPFSGPCNPCPTPPGSESDTECHVITQFHVAAYAKEPASACRCDGTGKRRQTRRPSPQNKQQHGLRPSYLLELASKYHGIREIRWRPRLQA
jgi:hypothetical protein